MLRFGCSSTQFDPRDYNKWHAGVGREAPLTGTTRRSPGWAASSWDSDELYSSHKYIISTPDQPSITDLSHLSVIASLVSPLHNCIDRAWSFIIASAWPTAMGHTDLLLQQHYISTLVTPPLPKECRKFKADPTTWRDHIIGNRPCSELFPCLRRYKQDYRVYRRAEDVTRWWGQFWYPRGAASYHKHSGRGWATHRRNITTSAARPRSTNISREPDPAIDALARLIMRARLIIHPPSQTGTPRTLRITIRGRGNTLHYCRHSAGIGPLITPSILLRWGRWRDIQCVVDCEY